MSESFNSRERDRFAYLGAAISLEFDECSIVAAETNKLVANQMANVKTRRDLRLISDSGIQTLDCVYKPLDAEINSGGVSELVLIQPLKKEIVHSPIKKRQGWLRRLVDVAEVNETTIRDNTILAAKFGSNFVVPIASFSRREDGRCSYVQIGQEMYDDNFFVTVADEVTSRNDFVESIRALVGYKKTYDSQEDKNAQAIVTKLADEEFQKHYDNVTNAKIIQAAERCGDLLRKKGTETTLNILGANGEINEQRADATELLYKAILEGGRIVTPVLYSSGDNDGIFYVAAQTRGNIALPLLSVDKKTNIMEVYATENYTLVDVSPKAKRKAANQLLKTLYANDKSPKIMLSSGEDYYNRSVNEKAGNEVARAEVLVQAGFVTPEDFTNYHMFLEKARDRYSSLSDGYYSYRDSKEGEKFLKDTMLYQDSPNMYQLLASRSSVADMAVNRIKHLQGYAEDLFKYHDVGRIFDLMLGPSTPSEEQLAKQLHELAIKGRLYEANIANVSIGKTRGSVALRVDIEREGTCYALTIGARPDSMPDEDFKPIMTHQFDLSGEIFKNGDRAKSAERASEIINIFRQLKPVG